MKTKVISQDIKRRCKECQKAAVLEALDILINNSLVNLTNSSETDFRRFQGELQSLENFKSLLI